MKKGITIILAVTLLLGLTTAAASAQFTTVTSFQVQNLTGSPANVTLQFYDVNGDIVAAATLSDTIDPNSSKLYTQANNPNLPSGFNGSVVVESDQPIAAIAVQEARDASDRVYQGTYGGFSAEQASDIFYLPISRALRAICFVDFTAVTLASKFLFATSILVISTIRSTLGLRTYPCSSASGWPGL